MLLVLLLLTCAVSKSSSTAAFEEEENWPIFIDEIESNKEYDSRVLNKEDNASGCHCTIKTETKIVCLGNKNYSYRPKLWLECGGPQECVRIPQINVETDALHIHYTSIEKIQKGDFKHWSNLTELSIENCPKLKHLENYCFKELVNLKNLSISSTSNALIIYAYAFSGLKNLEELNLIDNGVQKIRNLALAIRPSILPRLIKLSLDRKNFGNIEKDDMLPLAGSAIQELTLLTCHINEIHENAFDMMKNVTVLRLGKNPIQYNTTLQKLLRSMRRNGIKLEKLNLYKIGLTHLPSQLIQDIKDSNITELSLGGNQLSILKCNFHEHIPSIIKLDLQEVLMYEIAENSFSNLPRLERLYLKNNQISNITNRIAARQLKTLDLSNNLLNLERNAFSNLSSLFRLDLGYNRISYLNEYSFSELEDLRFLNLEGNVISGVTNGAFLGLKELTYLNLQSNPIYEAFNKSAFAGLVKLELLLLGNCKISRLKRGLFDALSSLRYIGLENNNLVRLLPDLFKFNSMLTDVNINSNRLASWNQQIFSNNTVQCLRAKDSFSTITKAMLEDFIYIRYIDVTSVLLQCEQNLFTSMKTSNLTNNKSWFGMPADKIPKCSMPRIHINKTLLDYYNFMENSGTSNDSTLKKIMATILVTSFLLILFVVYYRYRWHITYWVLLKKIYFIRRRKKKTTTVPTTATKHYDYDAFVSYSNEDRNFVVCLVSMLEQREPFLKLCVYERDFQIGSVISESVLENVAKSRKTLLVVSNAFTKSHWCRWEVQVAENYRLFFRNENGDLSNDSIVLIMLEHVNKSNMSPMLKYLMKTRIYLQWESSKPKQKAFWKKLRTALAPPCSTIIDISKEL